ncbi:S1 family peptidase [Parasphingorhabdus sp.]|uniref:S1 family peptidase n=1 Tax=Parasphingorhabdus sp. TaxID=2709688 RepID=UPI003BAE413C
MLFENASLFRATVASGLSFMNSANADSKLNLMDRNLFSEELLQAMICGGKSYKSGPVNYIWKCLVERELVIRATGYMPGAFVDHNLVLPLILEHLRSKTLSNIFAPPAALIERYKNAVVAIDVHNSSGSRSRGTGFFAVEENSNSGLLYTCKHNVDPDAGIEILNITTAAGAVVEFGPPRCHPTEDLAVIPVGQFGASEPVFRFREEVEVFDEVYTLGYPKVPCAEAGVIGHRGEINGKVKLFVGGSDVLLISNLVSPGNSGGPVLDRDGFCVGMSIKWLEGEWDGERARFSAALPASLIKQFKSQ